MHEPFVARTAARREQPFFLVALKAPVPRASLRRAAYERARIGGQIDVPLAPGRIDRVREDAKFAVDRGAGDDFEPLVAVGRKLRARERRHPDLGKRTLPHGLQAQVLIRRSSFCRRHLAPVALEDVRERQPLCGSPINDNAFVEVRLDAARPLLGVRPAIERFGLRREAGASDLYSPELAALLDGRHRTVLLNGVSPGCATGTVPKLSQNAF